MCSILTCTGIMAATVCSATAPYWGKYTGKRRNQGNAGLDSVLCSVHRRDIGKIIILDSLIQSAA